MSTPPVDHVPELAKLPLEIATQRLSMRPLVESDVEDLWPHASDAELTSFMSWGPHQNRDETRAFIAGQRDAIARGTDMVWGIEHGGKICGCIGLHGIKFVFQARRVDRAELGYWIGKPLWGQGLMTEAATAVVRWGFDTLQLHKVTVGCIEDNAASRRVIEKLGFRYLCKVEEDVWRDGRWWAHLRYELLASEHADLARTMRFNRPSRP